MKDPLAQFRRSPPVADAGLSPEDGIYIAFGAKDKVERLRIRRAGNVPTRSPAYHLLLDVIYDGGFGTNFALLYNFLMVNVTGRNLQPVVLAIETGTADFIQEFDPAKWDKPTDPSAPFIEAMEIFPMEERRHEDAPASKIPADA